MAGLIVTSSRPQHTNRGNRNRGESGSIFPMQDGTMAVFRDVQQNIARTVPQNCGAAHGCG